MSSTPQSTTTPATAAAPATTVVGTPATFATATVATGAGTGAASGSERERLPVEVSKGINGLEKIVLREVRGSSAEVILTDGLF